MTNTEVLKNIHVTCIKHAKVMIGKNGYSNERNTISLYELFGYYMMHYGVSVTKENKEAIQPHNVGFRISVNDNYNESDIWEGYIPVDVDIKDKELARKVYDNLSHCVTLPHYVAGISLSTSGKGLHIHCATKPNGSFQDNAYTVINELKEFCRDKGLPDDKYHTSVDGKVVTGDIWDTHNAKITQLLFRSSNDFWINDSFVFESINVKKQEQKEISKQNIKILKFDGDFTPVSDGMEPDDNGRRSISIVFYHLFGDNIDKFKTDVIPYIKNVKTRRKELLDWYKYVCKHTDKYTLNNFTINKCKKYFNFNINTETEESTQFVEDTKDVIYIERYISESKILQNYEWKGLNMLIAPTGTGKTSFFEKLSQKGVFDRIIIAQPMQASVLNKCDSLIEKGVDFGLLIETAALSKKLIKYKNKNAKLIYSVYDSFLNKGDEYITDNTLVVIDEIHNIFEVADWRNKIFTIVEKISKLNNVVIMTGTPTIERFIFPGIEKVFKVEASTYTNRHFHLININKMLDGKTVVGTYYDYLCDMVKRIVDKEQPDKLIMYSDSKQVLMFVKRTLIEYDIPLIYSAVIKNSDVIKGDIDNIDGFCATSSMKEGFDFKSKTGKNNKVVCIAIDNTKTQAFIPTIIQIGERIRNPKSIDTYYISRTLYKPNNTKVKDENVLEQISSVRSMCDLFRHFINWRDVKSVKNADTEQLEDVYDMYNLQRYINTIGYTFDSINVDKDIDDNTKYDFDWDAVGIKYNPNFGHICVWKEV